MTRQMIPKRIGQMIAGLRQERGLSQADLAQRALVTTRTIGRIERGLTRPHPATLAVLAAALDVQVIELENGVGPGLTGPTVTPREGKGT